MSDSLSSIPVTVPHEINSGGDCGVPAPPTHAEFLESAAQNCLVLTDPNSGVLSVAMGRPVVAGRLMMEPGHLLFGAFLRLEETQRDFRHGDAGVLVEDLRKAEEFPYFGVKVGRLSEQKAADRKKLTAFVRRAYRGSPRGVAYWARVAKVVWIAYERLLSMRYWAQRAEQCEIERLAKRAQRTFAEKARLRKRHEKAAAARKAAKQRQQAKQALRFKKNPAGGCPAAMSGHAPGKRRGAAT